MVRWYIWTFNYLVSHSDIIKKTKKQKTTTTTTTTTCFSISWPRNMHPKGQNTILMRFMVIS